jgi:inorganic triphosphatase YgiF
VPLPDPSSLLGAASIGAGNIGAAEDQQLDAVYFDTRDLRLLRAGVTLRRREGGSDPGWHLKLPVGKDSREELRVPLSQAPRTPPAELTALTRVHTRDAEVAPVVRLCTRRRRWRLADDDGRALAELVEDRVTAHPIGSDTEATSWREVEVELSEHGSVALLDQIEQRLLDAGAQRSGAASKLSRVLADRLRDDADRAEPDTGDSAGATVLAYLQEQAGRLRRFDPLVRRDAPDSVHQMRVASRRLRSALQAYRRVLDRDATGPLTEELKWLAGELAPARDSEVMAERFREMVDQLPPELVLGPVSATLDRTFARRQAEARERALAALDSDRYLSLQDALDALLAHPPLTQRAGRPAQRELPSHVRRALRRMRRGMAAVDQQPGGEHHDLALHETRKAANGCATPPRPQNRRWASRPGGCASGSSRCRNCSATTKTAWSPGRCCASLARRPASTAATASPSACCTAPKPPGRTAPARQLDAHDQTQKHPLAGPLSDRCRLHRSAVTPTPPPGPGSTAALRTDLVVSACWKCSRLFDAGLGGPVSGFRNPSSYPTRVKYSRVECRWRLS